MKKILVTTDFSANSKAAMRFALQLASQCDVALTFLHISHIPRPTIWSETTYATHEKSELNKVREALDHFVESVCKSREVKPTNYTCVVKNSPFPDSSIRDYAADHGFDYICISTRGAGMLEKLFGTTTANLINQSSVPIIAVPGTYRASKLTTVLYASDLSKLAPQLTHVIGFAEPLGASVELLHFSGLNESVIDPEIIDVAIHKHTSYPVTVHLKPRHFETTLTADIELIVDAQKPSVLIMFTTQNEGFFDRLFRSGNSIDCSFLTTVPLLVFSNR